MANYHMSIKIFSRGKGASAVQKAAYRAAEVLKNKYDGETHDYSKRKGVIHTEILLPENAPEEYKDRTVLWNAVEQIETFKAAQLAREIEISLPNELTQEQNIELARKFTQEVLVNEGMVADICVHDKNDGNIHAHIMLTMRPINEDGTWGQKSHTIDNRKVPTVDWNDREKAEYWRRKWADYQNKALKEYSEKARVDHRSYSRQGIEQVPTVHMGPEATWMEKRGIRTETCDRNREIAVTNKELAQVRARIKKLQDWMYAHPIADAPSMAEMLSGIKSSQALRTRWQKIKDLKTMANTFNFLQENNIYDINQLADKIEETYQRRYDLAETIKKQERRISTLDNHLAQVDIYLQHKALYKKYRQLDPKQTGAFAAKHAGAIKQFESAYKYLKDHLSGHAAIPEKEWKAERENLLSERRTHVEEYYDLKEDVRSIEVLRRSSEDIMSDATPERTSLKSRNKSL